MDQQDSQAQDPAAIVDAGPMSRFQWSIIAAMVALNALDGFDVMSISFAAPGIAADWQIDRAVLGLVLSMELVGMAIGSLTLGRLADTAGRRNTILLCLSLMTGGMIGAASAGGVTALSIWRVLTGLGIGGMLAAINAAAAEAANARYRPLAVVLMAGGYPVGTVLGGLVAAQLLEQFDWRSIFLFGAAWSGLMIAITWWRVPESIAFLASRQPEGALQRINRTLAAMGHRPVAGLDRSGGTSGKVPLARLFAPQWLAVTAAMTIAYLGHIMTFYFVMKWIPKIVADMGYPPPEAAGVLVWASVGGASGALIFGLLTLRLPVRGLTIGTMSLSTVLVVLFGLGQSDLARLSLVAAAAGFVTNAGVVGLYALVATSFPVALRASATGFVIGVGRGGSALAPALAGMLFAAGYGLPMVALLMSLGSIIAAAALLVRGQVR
ncbi:benzoate transport [Blastomonas natatoria]|uniref:Benzoate transport n=1 Tax=Blastomonas natatoria TaxID=34015 RepID=A0A2V3VM90_9SPHN|nr:MFS transporter [Blastomonas natatoria]PXW77719.1 benzoate transport [Blastomonas natatoria]